VGTQIPLLRTHRLRARRRKTQARVVDRSRPVLEETRRLDEAYEAAVARDDERDAKPVAGSRS
jgi:hypothetical protein